MQNAFICIYQAPNFVTLLITALSVIKLMLLIILNFESASDIQKNSILFLNFLSCFFLYFESFYLLTPFTET